MYSEVTQNNDEIWWKELREFNCFSKNYNLTLFIMLHRLIKGK